MTIEDLFIASPEHREILFYLVLTPLIIILTLIFSRRALKSRKNTLENIAGRRGYSYSTVFQKETIENIIMIKGGGTLSKNMLAQIFRLGMSHVISGKYKGKDFWLMDWSETERSGSVALFRTGSKLPMISIYRKNPLNIVFYDKIKIENNPQFSDRYILTSKNKEEAIRYLDKEKMDMLNGLNGKYEIHFENEIILIKTIYPVKNNKYEAFMDETFLMAERLSSK